MSKQPTTSSASHEVKFQTLQAIIEELEQTRERLPAISRQRFHSEALRDAMQNAFLAALKCGAFKDQNPKWVGLYIRRGNPNDLHVSELLGYAKVKGYVDGLWRSDPKPKGKGPYPYKGLIDEQAALLIELLRQEAAAGAENGGGEKADTPKAPAEDAPAATKPPRPKANENRLAQAYKASGMKRKAFAVSGEATNIAGEKITEQHLKYVLQKVRAYKDWQSK